MSALMPNSSGVYPNSVQGFNASIANQSAPRPDAFGSFGTDPITGATYTDKASAQAALGQYANPNSNASRYLASMQPTMLPGRPAPSGPSGRMGPQKPRRKIMTLGPRTAAEYTAERGSTLDNAYAAGNLTNPNAAPQPPAPAGTMTSPFNPFTPGQDAGGEVGAQIGQMFNDATKPKMMAKGGPMKMGSKPYLVGEEGPELIMPRGNGEGFVLPADVTAQILPTMRDVTPRKHGGPMSYTPRAEGGPMTLQSPSGRFAAITGDYGTGFASRIPGSDGIDLMASDTPRMMFDPTGRYQLNMDAPGLPMQPDTISGPFAEPAAPVTPAMRADLTQATADRAMALSAAPGTIAQSRYPGMTFTDAADGSGSAIPFEELQQRVNMRGIEAANQQFDLNDTRERNRVQLDLAARANRVPIGTPTAPVSQIPGMPMMSPSTLARVERNQERFLRSPEGAQFALNNAQRQAELQQRGQLASTAIAVRDPNTGQIMGYTTGTGASLPNMNRPRRVQSTEEINGQFYNFFDDGTAEEIANVPRTPGKQTVIDRINSKLIELPPGVDPSQLPAESYTVLGPKSTPEIGGATTDTTNPAAPAGPVTVKTIEEARALKPGTKFTTLDGRTFTR